jgi:hypothetical protein
MGTRYFRPPRLLTHGFDFLAAPPARASCFFGRRAHPPRLLSKMVFGVGCLKQLTRKIDIFSVDCLRRSTQKINLIFSVGRLKQPTQK